MDAEDAKSKILKTGFIAQEVEKVANDIGFDFDGISKPTSDEGTCYSLAYAQFVVPLVKAIQEQQIIIESQQKMIDELKTAIYSIQNASQITSTST